MLLKCLEVGDIRANCYILAFPEAKEAVVIDPGAEPEKILAAIKDLGFAVKHILLTHGHLDHLGAVEEVRKATGAKVAIHREDAECLTDPKKNLSSFFGSPLKCQPADILLEDGQELAVGGTILKVIHTPGHTRGGICLMCPEGVITGDTLFAGSVGRTDFPGGSMDQLLKGIRQKLLVLEPTTKIYPGHGPSSTIGEEKESNPYLT